MTTPIDRILICGAGLAGLSAAVTALEAGIQVLLIDKAPEPGGTTVLSGGLLWTIADFDDVRRLIPNGDAALQWLVFDTLEASVVWLQGLGVKTGPLEPVMFHGSGRSVEPAAMIATLVQRFEALGGEMMLDCGLEQLLLDGEGSVRGVVAAREGRLIELPARAVVLATGGFQGNHELLTRYVVPQPADLILRANRWSTGDGLIAATAVGAAASPGLSTFYGHALAAPPARFTKFQLRDASQYYGGLSVALNLHGERFADETAGSGEEALNQALARQPEGLGVYIVDAEGLDMPPIQGRPGVTRSMLARARSLGADVIEAPTLERLCEGLGQFGFPAAACLRTLQAFNQTLREDRADDLVPPRARHRRALQNAPFHAVKVRAGITFTMGGIQIDERGRVLRRAGGTSAFAEVPVDRAYVDLDAHASIAIGPDYRQSPIPGLYAAGNDAGNISHRGYMGGLASALTVGRTAGADAARYLAGASAFSGAA